MLTKTEKEDRKRNLTTIHEAICLKCGHHFNSPRHMNYHVANYHRNFNAQNQFNLNSMLPKSNSDDHILGFHKD